MLAFNSCLRQLSRVAGYPTSYLTMERKYISNFNELDKTEGQRIPIRYIILNLLKVTNKQ